MTTTKTKTYRNGAVGALMDEYERAVAELSRLVRGLSDAEFTLVRDRETKDDNCRSIQTIMHHVVRAGYGYSVDIRTASGVQAERPTLPIAGRLDCLDQLDVMMKYAEATLEDKYTYSDEQMMAVRIEARWGPVYDLEQWLEHAVVHILRHRRQIERFLARPPAAA